ncbi:hypothetical protein ABIE56_002350 [Luteibacter sp. 621]|jgi:hypothetical protein
MTMDGPGLRSFPGAGLFMATSLATLTPCQSHFPAGVRPFLLPDAALGTLGQVRPRYSGQ